MSRRFFRACNFREDAKLNIVRANQIVALYQAQGLRLTARQLYYQFVTKNWITNEERSYKNLTSLISKARLAGLLDWDAIEDRGRVPDHPPEFEDLDALAQAALRSYRLPRWEGQEVYAELWVEKQALAGVLQPLASEFHATLMVNKGYSSQSAMYESAKRFRASDRRPVLFYLGDHDPSGEDMVRDIRDRLEMFGVEGIEVNKVAITMEQIEEHNPPPNPAKITDPRAAKYIERHGDSSWEVDALPPNVLADLIRAEFERVIDVSLMDAVKEREEEDKQKLKAAVGRLMRARR